MIHRYKTPKPCPFCDQSVKEMYELEDSTLVCEECFDEETGGYPSYDETDEEEFE